MCLRREHGKRLVLFSGPRAAWELGQASGAFTSKDPRIIPRHTQTHPKHDPSTAGLRNGQGWCFGESIDRHIYGSARRVASGYDVLGTNIGAYMMSGQAFRHDHGQGVSNDSMGRAWQSPERVYNHCIL